MSIGIESRTATSLVKGPAEPQSTGKRILLGSLPTSDRGGYVAVHVTTVNIAAIVEPPGRRHRVGRSEGWPGGKVADCRAVGRDNSI